MADLKSFLSIVAEDLISRFGTNLADVAVIFPNRRMRLFFNNYLYEHVHEPVWAPTYYAIDDLFRQMTTLRPADPIKLVCELYKAYIQVHQDKVGKSSVAESLDEFYAFGEILLRDFDDIDKQLVNTRLLFSNLQDLDALKDDFNHLNESQLEALARYFRQTFQGNSSLQTAFWSIWNMLGEVYQTYQAQLENEQLAYPGMMMRRALENDSHVFSHDSYVFAGFNVLNKCEEQLFSRLKDKSLFYWDTDLYYLDEKGNARNEAGNFLAHNLRKFGSAIDKSPFDCLLSPEKEITIIHSASESGQSAAIAPWLDAISHPQAFTKPDSAIVLCNEQLLPVVMHSIPPKQVANVNITMGFPIAQTPVTSFLYALLELQIKGISPSRQAFRYKYVLPVLRHPYTQLILPEAKSVEKELLQSNLFFPSQETLIDKEIFRNTSDVTDLANYLLTLIRRLGKAMKGTEKEDDIYGGLYRESVFRAYQLLNRLYGLISSGELRIEKVTFFRLLKKINASTQVPFHGEPVRGLQIMGMLETRALDFDHLLLLSVNEGFMPGTSDDNTFIPQFLRKHFEMSTFEHQDSIYAYYFYRLIQRAKKVTLVYSTDKTQLGKAEMSRFILQLLIDKRLNIKRFSIQTPLIPLPTKTIEIRKDDALMSKIRGKYDSLINPDSIRLSPSAINKFIDCPLQFYFQYIEELMPEEELTDELDNAIFGTLFHKAAELLYREIARNNGQHDADSFLVREADLDPYLKWPHLTERIVNQAFTIAYFKNRQIDLGQYNGEQLINFKVVCHLLHRLIEIDKQRTPFIIRGLEHRVLGNFKLEAWNASLKISGIVDRFEEKDGTCYIIDYKTSGKHKTFKTMDDLVAPKDSRAAHVLQTFIYASVLIKEGKYDLPVVPALFYLQEAGKDDYSPVIAFEKEPISDFRTLNTAFEEAFIPKIAELFNPDIPFVQTAFSAKCSYCDFKNLCGRS
ncbi:MAG: PD-(D/E)XK nuclease family protein [Dysgonamonadaceae bacterium]|jgi:CRISPR/Cas system-associated exonuclease Cas4 (RecB family)|nr:PD-(D/E)XK nuclease family protein [Dysgonamonadaceae bacterium]